MSTRPRRLVALVQSLARLESRRASLPEALVDAEEVLEENRFLAARDGIEADLLDPVAELRRPARAQLRRLLDAVRPHADALGCRDDLERVIGLALAPAFQHQIDAAERGGGDLLGVTEELAAAFAPRVRPRRSVVREVRCAADDHRRELVEPGDHRVGAAQLVGAVGAGGDRDAAHAVGAARTRCRSGCRR